MSSPPSHFSRLRFILVETSHPGNVGSVARALKTMGYSNLYLVNPRIQDVLSHPEAIALSSGAQDVLENAVIVDTIEDALHGCGLAAAVSARLREFSPPILDPREFALQLSSHLCSSPQTSVAALILGNERTGLPNELVQKCNYLVNIPANPAYSSLNLAQAVQVLAYVCRYESAVKVVQPGIGFNGEKASLIDIEAMFSHLEQGLIAIGFIDPANPKKLLSRLRRLFARTQLEVEEVSILRGIAKKMLDK